MSGNVKQFVDFTGNTNNDTGENNASSIQPMLDGEGVTGAVLTRPSESLRQRTEAIRDVMTDSLYLRDADRNLLTFCLGGVTWPGSTSNAQSGIPVLTNTLWFVPMLTPGAVQVGAPPVASMFGVLHLKRSSDSANAISVTSRRRSYAAGDQINVTVTSGGVFSCVLDVESGLRRTIKIVATGTTTLGAVITALNGLIPPSPDNTQLVTAALEGGALSGDFLLAPQARQLVAGNYDGEAHQVTVSTLSSFFASNPTQALAEGDSLCIRYDMVADLASTGGRRQSVPENSNTSVPAGSLFNSRVHPEFIANALPICKVLNGRLVFGTGVEVPEGSVGFPLSGSAQGVAYNGGPNWADGTTNVATTVESQLDKIVTDLATGAGTAKIHGTAVGSDLAAGTLGQQIADLVSGWLKLNKANTVSATQTFTAAQTFAALVNAIDIHATGLVTVDGLLTANSGVVATTVGATGLISAAAGLTAGTNQSIAVSGSGVYKHGQRTKNIHALEGNFQSAASFNTTPAWFIADDGLDWFAGFGKIMTWSLGTTFPVGTTILAIRIRVKDNASGPTTFTAEARSSTGSTFSGTTVGGLVVSTGSGLAQYLTITNSGPINLPFVMLADTTYTVSINQNQVNNNHMFIHHVEVDYLQA